MNKKVFGEYKLLDVSVRLDRNNNMMKYSFIVNF